MGSKDKANNKEGKISWKTIKEMGWEILNSNKEGDEEGEWTYVGVGENQLVFAPKYFLHGMIKLICRH